MDQNEYMKSQDADEEKLRKLRTMVKKLKSELKDMAIRWRSEMRRRESCEERCRLRACEEEWKKVNRGLGREYEPISESDDESESDRKKLKMMSGGGETGSGRLRPGGSSTGVQNENHEWKDGKGEKIGGKRDEMGVEQVGKKGE